MIDCESIASWLNSVNIGVSRDIRVKKWREALKQKHKLYYFSPPPKEVYAAYCKTAEELCGKFERLVEILLLNYTKR